MPVVISSALSAAASSLAVPLKHPRIGYHDIVRTGTLTASSENGSNIKENAADGLTYDWWEPVGIGSEWIMVDAGSGVEVDYVGIAAHSIGTDEGGIRPQYSADAVSWTDAAAEFRPADDSPIMFLFTATTARYWRLLTSSGSSSPKIGVWMVGKALAAQRSIYVGHTPITMSRQTDIRPNRSEGGQWLGRSVIRKGNETGVELEHLTASWVRSDFGPFIEHARTLGFFFAWRPDTYSDEVAYGWSNDDITPQNTGPGDLMSVSFTVTGIAE